MPNRRKPMKKIREAIRMVKELNFSYRQTSNTLGISRPTIQEYISKFEKSGLTVNEIFEMNDSDLTGIFDEKSEENSLADTKLATLYKEFPNYSKELLLTGVNLMILWGEYREKYPEGLSYSRFCYHY